jgi:hypothetical protein
MDSAIFENPNFLLPNTNIVIKSTFFLRGGGPGAERYRRLTLKECLNGNNVKSREDFHRDGIFLSIANWLTLVGAIAGWKNNIRRLQGIFDPNYCTQRFISSLKKGSRIVRNTVLNISLSDGDPCEIPSAITFGRLIDCRLPDPQSTGTWFKAWAVSYIPNEIKTFIYNCRFNCLPLNNRLNAYMHEIDDRCSFCKIIDNLTTQREGFLHVFLKCPTTKKILNSVIDKIDLNLGIDSDDFLKLYWFGISENGGHSQITWLIFFDIFRHVLFKFKFKKNIPNNDSFLRDFCTSLSKLCVASKKFKENLNLQQELAWFSRAIG